MARKFDLEKTLDEIFETTTRGGRSVNLSKIVADVADLSGRLPENVRKSVLPLTMRKLVRIGEEDFVADEFMTFNSLEIDGIVDAKMGASNYLPIRAFESFESFPPCSNVRSWNLYVFESYCLKKSERFKRVALLFNKQCSGAVVRADYDATFHEILVDATAKSNLKKLTPDVVIDYLKDAGYIGKAKYERIDELLAAVEVARKNYLIAKTKGNFDEDDNS